MSRLRERLRTTAHAVPPGIQADADWERCEIVAQYVSGSINLQYRFRAAARRGRTSYSAGTSSSFLTTPPPIPPSESARAALAELIDLLAQEGWQPESQPDIEPWYAQTLRRELPKHGKPPPIRRRAANRLSDA
jgi:hypothetical protein